ncbi:MAG: MBL fold metallo-hydrolase [Gammaproteobacteria bacterium]|nr:MBL fold metallo-hydrolase [Gammaproteobacteria bacterium]
MRFASIGSGSRGNGTLVEHDGTLILLDCGFSAAETRRRFSRLGLALEELDAILVTHEHGDHVSGVGVVARAAGVPVWMTPGTHHKVSATMGAVPDLQLFNSHEPFQIDGLEIHPFPVPHDAREPVQFRLEEGARSLGVLTDCGHGTAMIRQMLSGCDALLLEANHDITMLREGAYPPALQERVGGRYGHLANGESMAILRGLEAGSLQHLVAAHLSEQNNDPDIVRAGFAEVLGCEPEWIGIADQEQGLAWREIS